MVGILKFRKLYLHFAMLMAIAAGPLLAAEVAVELDRESVTAGNGALMTLRVTGNGSERPEFPAVENLIIEPRGQSRQIQMFNGNMSVATSYTYAVGSNIPGDYQIPAIEVMIDGKKHSTTPLKLKVLASSAAQPPPALPGGQATPPGGSQAPVGDESERFGFLTVELAANDRKHVYVGEIAPVRIRAWLPVDSRANLRSGIQPEGKAFTLHHVSDRPEQTQEVRDGKRYTVVTWYGGISATKAGSYPASLSLDATVAVRDTSAPAQRRHRGGPFDDPFFDDIFQTTPTVQKDVTLKSEDQEIEVRALPPEGRPAGFAGAVGKFQFARSGIPSSWKTGEPQQVEATINGSGNFALLNEPVMLPAEEWKVYPGKSDFTPGDQASFAGTKAFRFNAVPRKSGEREVTLAFSYFDPEAAVYRTLTTSPKKVSVTGADLVEGTPAEVPPVAQPPQRKPDDMAPLHSVRDPAASLLPLVSRPAFYQILGSSAAMALLGGFAGMLRFRRADPRRRNAARADKAVREALHAAGRAVEVNDVPGFFAAARQAIQHRLALLWSQPPLAITSAEIQARVAADSPVARFFDEADRHAYGHSPDAENFPQWRALLDDSLASLNPNHAVK